MTESTIIMSFTDLLKKATNFLGIGSPETHRPPPLDGEIIFCKNNVCVHPPAALTNELEHYPGYLNIRSQDDKVLGSTLILTWIPNSTLKKNPRSIENSPGRGRISPRRSPRQEFARDISSPAEDNKAEKTMASPSNEIAKQYEGYKSQTSDSGISQDMSLCSEEFGHSLKEDVIQEERGEGVREGECPSTDSESPSTDEQLVALLKRSKIKNPLTSSVQDMDSRRRTSSGRSVTSIEMEGDSLVVVTESAEDDEESAFLDDADSSVKKDPPSDASPESFSSDSPVSSEKDMARLQELKNARNVSPEVASLSSDKTSVEKLKESLDLKLTLQNLPETCVTPDIQIIESPQRSRHFSTASSTSTSTSGPDTNPPSPISSPEFLSPDMDSTSHGYVLASSQESLVAQHNMSFPSNAVMFSSAPVQSPGGTVQRSAKDQLCGVFSVDLGQMRSLRIFYTDDACTSGQLVIASRESQYKILNFHHGGLERLADTLSHWKFLAPSLREKFFPFSLPPRQRGESDSRSRHFSVIRPYLTDEQRHPEEGAYEAVNEETWRQHMNERGQIEDDFHLRRAIFFAGLDPSLRHEMWPFLLHYYPYQSTHEEREHIRNDRYIVYQNLRKQREEMSPTEAEEFWRHVQCTVEKDVVRTDRSHPYFRGEDNPNIDILKEILLSYAVAHPHYGYTQGMSDLLAPVLVEVQNEVDAYWCFVGLMQQTIFVSSPKDMDMDKQLRYLQELLRLMLPHFYKHLSLIEDGMELLFVHRWILLCFKREFPEADALRMWEACWAHYQTDYFHLFICVAIIAVYGEDVVQQNLPADEMLLHFSSLSMHMSGDVVLRKARGLLHHFRTMSKIPCTLDGICTLCGSGMWDSGHVPSIECVGNHPESDDQCPFGGKLAA